MADVHSKVTRSYNMSRIRSKNTKPEMLVRKFLHAQGFRYRLHVKDLPGKPDVVLSKYKTVILIHGCFWHSHEGCKLNRVPKDNQGYWVPKLAKNVAKDKENETELNNRRWNIIVVWECDLKKGKIEDTFKRILLLLTSNLPNT